VDSSEDDGLRFRPSQALLLDALLEERQARVPVDKGFSTWRNKLKTFVGVRPCSAPRGFSGALRPHQQEGLGWLRFLCDFQLRGCLADDMGLGKTVQVLALLESVRTKAEHPSIVVVPKSLVVQLAGRGSEVHTTAQNP